MSLHHLLLLPTLACPANCDYCFGPRAGGPRMTPATLEAVASWLASVRGEDTWHITFHGGEPLAAGASFFEMAIPLLRDAVAPASVSFAMQSNLWMLSDDLCALFKNYGVVIGTSLDGPEWINDAQRGKGYYRRTAEGIRRARASGLEPGCICTFTSQSARRAEEVLSFFAELHLDWNVHAALPAFGRPAHARSLPPEEYGRLFVRLLDLYLACPTGVRCRSLEVLCQSVSAGRGASCTFGDCLGRYVAIAPNGDMYTCQRLVGQAQFRIGNVRSIPSLEELGSSTAWQSLAAARARALEECADCAHYAYCRGGCVYNALAARHADAKQAGRDPYCASYKQIFDHILDRAMEEVFSAENLASIVENGPGDQGLLHRGRLLQMMRAAPGQAPAA